MENRNEIISLVNESEKVNPLVKKCFSTLNKLSLNEEGNFGIEFTHYLEVEKEMRKLKFKISENPFLKEVFDDLVSSVELFMGVERLREIKFNAAYRVNKSDYYQIDSSSEVAFYRVMKNIITLQAMLDTKINPKFRPIVDEILEDMILMVENARENDLEDPVKVYKKQIKPLY